MHTRPSEGRKATAHVVSVGAEGAQRGSVHVGTKNKRMASIKHKDET